MLMMAMKKHGDVSAGAIMINEGDGGPTEKKDTFTNERALFLS